jgi:hypothetical protein
MKDWKAIAKAGGYNIPPADLDQLAALESLESSFRPLVKDLPLELEPASTFNLEDSE